MTKGLLVQRSRFDDHRGHDPRSSGGESTGAPVDMKCSLYHVVYSTIFI